MKIQYSTPVLCSSTRTGKAKYWQGHVVQQGEKWFTQTSYWQLKNDGTPSAVQWSEAYKIEPKNVGRANATTAEQQAYMELESTLKRQRDKGYTEEGEASTILPLPMLAHKFADRGHKVIWPAYVQPKLNGQRMLFDGEKGWSRGGKEILPECIAHIREQLAGIPEGVILDGELILPGNPLLQKTMTAIKKYRPDLSPTLLYWVYDIVDPTLPFSWRFEKLSGILSVDLPNVLCVPTVVVEDSSQVMSNHQRFVEEGYEGSMVRYDEDGYDIGHRNNQLQKVKDFVDGEFEVLDIVEGGGRFKGSAIFVCRATETETFTCVPEGDMEYKKGLFSNREKILKMNPYLTVRYQELSKDGVPIFPVGVSLRETKDEGY